MTALHEVFPAYMPEEERRCFFYFRDLTPAVHAAVEDAVALG